MASGRILQPESFLVAALFAVTRLVNLTALPVLNDESLYVHYSQLISSDWSSFRFISLDNPNLDWKPPLQYWLAAPFINLSDPVLAARLVTAAVSSAGLVSVYAFALKYFGRRDIAFWAGLLWTLNPMVLFYDRVFLAEAYVYSFSAALFLFAWMALTERRAWIIPASLAGAMALLSKQPGKLAVISLLFLVLSRLKKAPEGGRPRAGLADALVISLIMALSFLIYRAVLPPEAFGAYASFTGRWTFTLRELSGLPFGAWYRNLLMVFDLYGRYYTFLVIFFSAYFALLALWKRDARMAVILALFAFNSFAIILGLKGFNEYIYNTSCAFSLTMVAATAISEVREVVPGRLKSLERAAIAAPGAALVLLWAFPLGLYYTSPGAYMERYGTQWMKENYLLGWPNGFGIREAVELLKAEGDKTLYVDPQPGNPRTALFVYRGLYPSIEVRPMDAAFFSNIGGLDPGKTLLIFRDRPERAWEDALLASPLCSEMTIFRQYQGQYPLVYCGRARDRSPSSARLPAPR